MRLLSLIEVLFRAAGSLQDSCETCFEKQAGKSSRLRRKKILVSDHHTETSRELSACSNSGSKVALKLLARSMWSVHACAYYSVIGMVLLLSCFARLESQIWSHAHHSSHSIQPLYLERLSFSNRIVYRRQEFNRKILIPGSASEQSNAVQLQQEPISHSLVSSQEPSSAFSQELLLQFNGSKADDSDHVCRGKRIYIYDLPPEFNSDLVARCRYGITSWLNFCPHTSNDGLGATLDCEEKLPWKFAPPGLTTTTTTTAVSDDAFTKGWYKTDPYMLELIFHSRLQSYPCRTSNSAIADVFFIPYYTGLDALRYLYNTTVIPSPIPLPFINALSPYVRVLSAYPPARLDRHQEPVILHSSVCKSVQETAYLSLPSSLSHFVLSFVLYCAITDRYSRTKSRSVEQTTDMIAMPPSQFQCRLKNIIASRIAFEPRSSLVLTQFVYECPECPPVPCPHWTVVSAHHSTLSAFF